MKELFVKVFLPLVSIVLMLFLVTVMDPIKPQEASTFIFSHSDSCNDVHIDVSESACSPGANSYGTTATLSIQNTSGTISHTVNWVWLSYFCPEGGFPSTDSAGKPSCLENKRIFSGTTVVNNGSQNNQPVSISNMPASFNFPQFAACGTYQNDFFITSIDGNSNCHFGTYSTNDASWVTYLAGTCNTGNVCKVASSPTATPTPTTTLQQPTATPTPTPAFFPTNTPIPSNPSINSTTNSNSQSNFQSQSQTQNNNQTVNVSVAGASATTVPTATPVPVIASGQVLGTATVQQPVVASPTIPELPNTGAGSDILFGLLTLIPIGWKIRKLV